MAPVPKPGYDSLLVAVDVSIGWGCLTVLALRLGRESPPAYVEKLPTAAFNPSLK